MQNYETTVVSSTGIMIPALVSTSILRSHAGTDDGVVLIIKDITERKKAEQALREAEERYRQAESLAAIGQMVSVVAHEVRNPLQNIQLGVDTLKPLLTSNKDLHEILWEINYGLTILNRTVEDLLEYSRPARLQYSPCSTQNIVDFALKAIEHKMGKTNIRMELDQEKREIYVDGAKIGTVLTNLFSNSLEAMPNGGELEVSSRFQEENGVCSLDLCVSDTGCGIEQQNLKKIIKPFFTTKTRGTGLGLPACRKIVEAHGGRLEISSKVNVGTRIGIHLPVQPPVSPNP